MFDNEFESNLAIDENGIDIRLESLIFDFSLH
jgi:hypothetical protein